MEKCSVCLDYCIENKIQCYFVGLIDILCEYGLKKQLETSTALIAVNEDKKDGMTPLITA